MKQPPTSHKSSRTRYVLLALLLIAALVMIATLLIFFLSKDEAPSLRSRINIDNSVISQDSIQAPPALNSEFDDTSSDTNSNRFVKLSNQGNPIDDDETEWPCVLDSDKQLIWEVKQNDGGWQDHEFTYSWYQANSDAIVGKNNKAGNGREDGGQCYFISCDTQAYIEQMNSHEVCGLDNWRLPTREELKSLDHPTNFNPDIDTEFFPQTMLGYYWSSTETPNNKGIALAIDFHNNIGYATEKRLAYFVRAVSSAGTK